jgi:uncharacterized protein YjiS (DUF1127 family)
MALTELQLPTKANFYSDLRSAATRMNNLMAQWAEMAEFLARMDTQDLTDIGVPTGGAIRTDISDFRVAVQELIAYWNGTKTDAPTKTPEDIINKIRSMTGRGQ